MPYSTNEEEAALDTTNLFEEDFGDESLVVEDDINGETNKKTSDQIRRSISQFL